MPPKRKKATSNIEPGPGPSAKKPARSKKATSTIPTPDWPPSFTQLERVHRALNLVYTFCSTRMATTFDALKSAVESHTKKDLAISDVAQIKFLDPNSINFEYVNEDLLQRYIAADGAAPVDALAHGAGTARAGDLRADGALRA